MRTMEKWQKEFVAYGQESGYGIDDRSPLCPIIQGTLLPQHLENNAFYDSRLKAYDDNLHLTFDAHGEVEALVREELISRLSPEGKTILELGAGTGRDSVIFLESFEDVRLVVLEPAPGMLHVALEKIIKTGAPALAINSGAEKIPLPDNSVQGVYSFGGFNEFTDKKAVINEIVRVCETGARVVLCDEGIPPWWRETDFYRILRHTNIQFEAEPPLKYLPVEARNAELSWVIGETFWVISFDIAGGPPQGKFDIPIPGAKGGTLSSRYFGQVEGVSSEVREALTRHVSSGIESEHSAVDKALRNYLLQE
jgi:ubiquinone/menaquinone biosynthesis C-methylase UbiE